MASDEQEVVSSWGALVTRLVHGISRVRLDRLVPYEVGAKPIFGLPDDVPASPIELIIFATGYIEGRLLASSDINKGQLNLEGYGFGFEAPLAPNF